MSEKLPYIALYVGDYLSDNVAGCSLAAQGLWMRMMMVMHKSERYGYLVMDRLSMPDEYVARRCGATVVEYQSLLKELSAAGVPGRTADGIIYSRRMVRDAEERRKAAERKRKQRSDEEEAKQSIKPPRHGSSHADVTDDVTPQSRDISMSSSLSVSSSTSEKEEKTSPSASAAGKSGPAPASPREKAIPSPQGQQLAERLRAAILKNKPDAKVPPKLDEWGRCADLMIRIDKRSIPAIEAVIDFVQGNDFWRSNCMSMGTIREKFDRLELKIREKTGQKTVSPEIAKAIRAFQIAQGHRDDQNWKSLMFSKSIEPATQLLAYFDGDLEQAIACIEHVANHFVDTQYSWGWDAILKRAPAFKKGEAWSST